MNKILLGAFKTYDALYNKNAEGINWKTIINAAFNIIEDARGRISYQEFIGFNSGDWYIEGDYTFPYIVWEVGMIEKNVDELRRISKKKLPFLRLYDATDSTNYYIEEQRVITIDEDYINSYKKFREDLKNEISMARF